MKKGHFDSKKGGNVLFFPKNWNQILRPAINEWRPKKMISKMYWLIGFLKHHKILRKSDV